MIPIIGQGCLISRWRGGFVALAGVASFLLPGVSAAAETRPPGVPVEAVPFNGHWYALYYEEIASWTDAVKACEAKGGSLACMESPEERKFIIDYANSVTSRRFWVGGVQKDDQWAWTTGPAIPSSEITGKVPTGNVRLCLSSTEQGRTLTPVPERPVSELKSYVCEWVPKETLASAPPGSSTPPSSSPSMTGTSSTAGPKVSGPAAKEDQGGKAAGGTVGANKDRTWSSTNGTQLVATLVEFDGKVVKLQTRERQVNLMVNQLSPDDQLFLKSLGDAKPVASPPPAKPAAASPSQPAPAKPWPEVVEVSRTPEIKVVAENEKGKRFVYRSPHYEFTSPIQLANSVVQELAVIFEATYALLDALPVGLNLRAGETDPLKVLLVEDVTGIIKLGGPGGNDYTYLSKIDSVVVTLGNLGAEKKNDRWSFTANKATLSDVRLRIVEQFLSKVGGWLPVWFDIGFGRYVSEMRYDSGRYFVSSQRAAIRDFLKQQNSATTFPMPDLKSCMEMTGREWDALIHANKLDDHYPASVLLVYYFLHLDGQGDSASAANFVKSLADRIPFKEAQERFLMRGRSYDELTADVETKFRDIGFRVEVQPPKS